MKNIELYVIWIVVGVIWFAVKFDPFWTISGSALLLLIFIKIRSGRLKELMKNVKNGELKYYQIRNYSEERLKDIFIIPALIAFLALILKNSEAYQSNDLFVAFIATPVMPIIFFWFSKVTFHKFANGVIISDSYIQDGFEGKKIKWKKIKKTIIENEKIIFITTTMKISKEIKTNDIERIASIVSQNGVEIENKNVTQQ